MLLINRRFLYSILPHSVIMEDPSESSNTENQSESDKKSSSISVSSSDVPDKTEQASSNREDCVRYYIL